MQLNTEFFKIALSEKGNMEVTIHWVIQLLIASISLWYLITWWFRSTRNKFLSTLKIDQVQLGIGNQKVTLSPDYKDRQIAHKLWVELNTRKIGIEINFDDDVIIELYDSWYIFFQITRELIKDIPVENIKAKKNEVEFVDIAIDVLNIGIRPHLTRWQSRFRRWYENEINQQEQTIRVLSPQEIQSRYPYYKELIADMKDVNSRLIYYKTQLRKMSRND